MRRQAPWFAIMAFILSGCGDADESAKPPAADAEVNAPDSAAPDISAPDTDESSDATGPDGAAAGDASADGGLADGADATTLDAAEASDSADATVVDGTAADTAVADTFVAPDAADASLASDAALDVSDARDAATDAGPKKCSSDAECDDGAFCTGVETCNPSLGDPVTGCVPGTPPSCSDGVACTIDACDEFAKCTHVPNHVACDDGTYCNGVEVCDVVLGCKAGPAVSCSDGIVCTVDACSESEKKCTHTAQNSECNDGVFCNGVETCSLTEGCVLGPPPSCDDGVGCTVDSCSESEGGCQHVPNNAACSPLVCSPSSPGTGCVTPP